MPNKIIVKKINNKRDELAQDVEIAAKLWIQQGNNQKLLHLSKEMDQLFNEYYQIPEKEEQIAPINIEFNESKIKDNVSLWIKTVNNDGKKMYECWVKEFGQTTKIGSFFKRTSKWSGSGAQDSGILYILEKYPYLKNIKMVDVDTIKEKYSTTWKKVNNSNLNI